MYPGSTEPFLSILSAMEEGPGAEKLKDRLFSAHDKSNGQKKGIFPLSEADSRRGFRFWL
jgi:hypothetical protein